MNGVKPHSKIHFMSDTKSFFSKNHGWDAGMGDRNGRWAMIVEKDGTVSAADVEKSPRDVTVSCQLADSMYCRLTPVGIWRGSRACEAVDIQYDIVSRRTM